MPRITPSPDLSTHLGALTLAGATGQPVKLGATWADRDVVLVHLRHFGCLYCRKQLAVLKEAHPRFVAQRTTVLAIGTGDTAYARTVTYELALPFLVLADDALASYAVVGTKETSLLNWVRPGNLTTVASVMREGHRQGPAGNHQRYLGATHVISKGGRPSYAWLNQDFSDDAPLHEVFDVVEKL